MYRSRFCASLRKTARPSSVPAIFTQHTFPVHLNKGNRCSNFNQFTLTPRAVPEHSKTRGNAAKSFRLLFPSTPEPTVKFDDLKVKPYLSPFERLTTLRQGKKSVKWYIRRFCSIVAELPPDQINITRLLELFVDGLNYRTQLWLFLFHPHTCEEAIRIAISFETTNWDFLAGPRRRNHGGDSAANSGAY